MARILLTVTALIAIYFVLPLDHGLGESVVLLIGELIVVAIIGVLQVRATIRSSRPALRAVEGLAVSIPSLILVFAVAYYLLAQSDPAAFSQPLGRVDALYFTMTTFSTTGFGDITATTGTTRGVVTLQMAVDLVVLGVGLRVLTGAVKLSRERGGRGPIGS